MQGPSSGRRDRRTGGRSTGPARSRGWREPRGASRLKPGLYERSPLIQGFQPSSKAARKDRAAARSARSRFSPERRQARPAARCGRTEGVSQGALGIPQQAPGIAVGPSERATARLSEPVACHRAQAAGTAGDRVVVLRPASAPPLARPYVSIPSIFGKLPRILWIIAERSKLIPIMCTEQHIRHGLIAGCNR